MQIEMNREIAAKVVETVDKGLSSGLGKPIPGQFASADQAGAQGVHGLDLCDTK